MDQANHSSSSSLLLPLREKSEDFGMVSTFGQRFLDQSDGIGIDRKAATIEPVLDIYSSSGPFKIIGPRISPIFILMMHDRQIKGIRHEGYRHQSMYRNSFDFASLSKLNLGIVVSAGAIGPNVGSGVTPSFPTVDIPTDAFDAANIADFVQPFISSNRKPFFSNFVSYVLNLLRYCYGNYHGSLNLTIRRSVGSASAR